MDRFSMWMGELWLILESSRKALYIVPYSKCPQLWVKRMAGGVFCLKSFLLEEFLSKEFFCLKSYQVI